LNPKLLIIIGAVVGVLFLSAIGAYFFIFRSTQPVEDPALAAQKLDSDSDGYTDVDELAQGTDPKDSKRFPGSHKKVLFAKQDISANILITENMLDVKEVAAKGEAPDATVLDLDRARVVGHISTVDIKTGDFVVDAMIFGGQPKLAFLVPQYKRAISLKYDELAAVNGLIQLGDIVDVIGHFRVQRREGSPIDYTRIIVQNARVIAIGPRFIPKSEADTSPESIPTGLTLSVFPHEAERLIWAENYLSGGALGARLVLALKSPMNSAQENTAGVLDNTLIGKDIIADPRAIEIYHGTKYGGVARFGRPDDERMGLNKLEGSQLAPQTGVGQ